jgi:small subunit ribosomal protein S17
MKQKSTLPPHGAKATSACSDPHCPTHGHLKTHGRTFKGVVTSSKMSRTVIVEWESKNYMPKYERYQKGRTRIKVHNPPCINATDGDIVQITESRPISKTKNFVVISVLGKEKDFIQKMEGREAAKVKEKEEEPKVEAPHKKQRQDEDEE